MENSVRGFLRDLFAVKFDHAAHDPESIRINGDGKCYPNCDSSVWLRSCKEEIIKPINGMVKGIIPAWIDGSLLRNGPGNLKVGDMQFQHLFDSSALVHRFGIKNGTVTYQCRFVQTETYKRNMAAQRIVITEFGTSAVPDPCQSIFQRVASVFKPGSSTSDNSMISVYPFGDEYYTFTESPVIHRINPETLATEGRVIISDFVGIINHTSHPHVMSDGTVYNLGMSATKLGPAYNIICFPRGEHMFEEAHLVGVVPCRWKFHPGYMHTFGITENYFVIVEQPLSVSIKQYLKAQIANEKLASSLKWFGNKPTLIHLMDRRTGKVKHTFRAEGFFYLHIINQYEEENHVVVDICCYKDPSMINCMYIESMANMQNNARYAEMFRGRPLRFVLPLKIDTPSDQRVLIKSFSFTNIFPTSFPSRRLVKHSQSEYQDLSNSHLKESHSNVEIKKNFVSLRGSNAKAFKMHDGGVVVQPELLCDMGCETPRINYENYVGRKYRFFYAISSDVDAENPGTVRITFAYIKRDTGREQLIKVDTVKKSKLTWCETNCYPSEPIFVPSPNSKSEDDGIVLSSMVWGNLEENKVGLLVLCAKSWTEIGRCEFKTPGPVPKCLHGWFASNKNTKGKKP